MATKAKYYGAGFKRVEINGAPCRVPEWFGEVGKGPELTEAERPRGFKAAYYVGGHRMVIEGAPVRMAEHVKKWKAANKAGVYKSVSIKEYRAIEKTLVELAA